MFGKYPALNTRIISVDYVIFVTCIGDIELGKSRFVYVTDDYMKSNKCLYVCVCMCVCVCVCSSGWGFGLFKNYRRFEEHIPV